MRPGVEERIAFFSCFRFHKVHQNPEDEKRGFS